VRDTGDTAGDGDECSALGARARHNCSLPRELDVESHQGARAEQDETEASSANVEIMMTVPIRVIEMDPSTEVSKQTRKDDRHIRRCVGGHAPGRILPVESSAKT
jgi:hypothetical protein